MRQICYYVAVISTILFTQSITYCQDTLFTPPEFYRVGGRTASVIATDIDNDGLPDVVSANAGDGSISILKNSGGRAFQEEVRFAVGWYPTSVVSGDLNGDSNQDLVVSNSMGNDISVLINNGDGTFQPQVIYGCGTRPNSICVADIDGDTYLDIISANRFSSDISFLKNNGNGTFQIPINYSAGLEPMSIFASDLNNDGAIDLAVGKAWETLLSVLINNGDGTFQPAVEYYVDCGGGSICGGDFDGDNDIDLVITLGRFCQVVTFFNNGDGTFQNGPWYGTGCSCNFVTALDIDNDGHKDLAAANPAEDFISVLRNNGDGTFQVDENYAAWRSPEAIALSDLDNDGDKDIAIAISGSGSIGIMYNSLNSDDMRRFNLISPQNGQAVIDAAPLLIWSSSSSPDSGNSVFYRVYWDDEVIFNNPDSSVELDDTTFNISSLPRARNYYWRVAAFDHLHFRRFSQEYWSFYLNDIPPEPFPLYRPTDGEHQVVNNIEFSWGSTIDYDPNSTFTYSIQISPDSAFRWIQKQVVGITDTVVSVPTDSLSLFGSQPYWRVLAINDDSLIRIGGIPEQVRRLNILSPGDANLSGTVTGLDVIFLVNYFKGRGPSPDPLLAGDSNGSCITTGLDVTYLVRFFKGIGPAPRRCGS
jgi:hypothetical protein